MHNVLYPFQTEAVTFLTTTVPEMNHWPHKLLAFDPGLGKTPTACVAAKKVARTVLIVVPKPIKRTWRRQLINWGVAPAAKIFIVETNADVIPQDATHVIVNYDIVTPVMRKRGDKEYKDDRIFAQLYLRKWDAIIIDEAQRLRGPKSARSKAIIGKTGVASRCYWKWMLSGSIMMNRPMDLFTSLRSLAPMLIAPYDTFTEFGKQFCNGFLEGFGAWNFKGASNTEDLAKRIEPFMFVKKVEDVYAEMPPKIVSEVFIDVGTLEGATIHNTPMATMRQIVGLAKAPYVVEYAADIIDEEQEKVVIFTYHRTVTEAICDGLSKYKARKIYGGTTDAEREAAMDAFINGDCMALVINMHAAGEGVDGLQHATRNVILAEEDWSPGTVDKQLIGRLRRIGQTRSIRVSKCIAEGTMDEMSLDEIMEYARNSRNNVIDRLIRTTMKEYKMAVDLNDLVVRTVKALEEIAASLNGERVVGNIVNDTKPEAKPEGKPQSKPNAKNKDKDAGTAHAKDAKAEKNATAAEGAPDSGAAQAEAKNDAASAEGSKEADAPGTLTLDQLKEKARVVMTKLGGSAVKDEKARADVKAKVLTPLGAGKFDELESAKYVEAAALLDALLAPETDDLGL